MQNNGPAQLAEALKHRGLEGSSVASGKRWVLLLWLVAGVALAQAEPARSEAELQALIKRLEDSDARVREESATALGRLGPAAAAAIPRLRKALHDPELAVQIAAIHALGSIGPAARGIEQSLFYAWLLPLPELQNAVRDALRGLYPETGLDEWMDQLQAPRALDRWVAAMALGNLGPQAIRALPALLDTWDDEKPWVCSAAAQAVGLIGEAAVPAVLEKLRGDTLDERIWAAAALEMMVPPPMEALPPLLEALGASNAMLRSSATISLGQAGVAIVPALIERLGSKNAEEREAAAGALERMGPEAAPAVPALVRLLEDRSKPVRRQAVRALGKIGPAARDAVPELIRRLEDEDLRSEAVVALGRIGGEARTAVFALTRLLQDRNASLRRRAAEALKQIEPSTP